MLVSETRGQKVSERKGLPEKADRRSEASLVKGVVTVSKGFIQHLVDQRVRGKMPERVNRFATVRVGYESIEKMSDADRPAVRNGWRGPLISQNTALMAALETEVRMLVPSVLFFAFPLSPILTPVQL